MRLKHGRKIVTPLIREVLRDRRHIFKEYFTAEKVSFLGKNEDIKEEALVYCNQIEEFIEFLAMLRGKNFTDMTEKIGMDMGKGKLKLTLTMYDEDDVIPVESHSRVTREDGIGGGHVYRDLGGRKVIILAAVPDIPENYENCQTIFEKVQLKKILYRFAGDIKIYKIVGGMMSGNSKHPCPYCETPRNKDGTWEEPGKLRSFRDIEQNCTDWLNEDNGDRKKAKDHKNCVAK